LAKGINMGKIIKVEVCCVLDIDEDSISSLPEQRELDIQDEIKYAIQRVQLGSDERVSWSIDYYLNENMPKWLSKLKDAGTPLNVFTEEELSDPEGVSDEVSNVAHSRWEKILETMIAGFEAADKLEDGHGSEEDNKELWEAFNLGMDNFKKYYFCLWD
jgi:hypothetical protein